jgi:peptidoglycan/LPS O-acetylase OafA/YrhL
MSKGSRKSELCHSNAHSGQGKYGVFDMRVTPISLSYDTVGRKLGDSAMTKSRVPELDLLRFVAALAVVIYHCGHRADLGATVGRATEFGFLGVQLFFMISGFVILWTAIGKSAPEFVISRISRLYPTFWVGVSLTAATLYFLHLPPSLTTLLANFTMIPAILRFPVLDEVYWTLIIEIKFYAVIFGLLLIRQLAHIRRFLACWLLVSVLAPFYPRLHALALDQLSVYFIAGCYLYLLRTERAVADLLPLAACAILSVYNAVGMQEKFTHDPSLTASVWIGAIVILEYAVFLSVALRALSLPAGPLWGWLGAMTYPLYLVHSGVVQRLGSHYLAPGPLRFAIMLSSSLLLAWILAATIERKGCSALNRWLLRLWIDLLGSNRKSDLLKEQ